jgi:Phosphatidylinositol-glycan biosynthesis class S protein
LAAVTFVVIFLAVGLPVWWQTTTVHRAPLPYDEIESLPISPPKQNVKIYFKSSEPFKEKFQALGSELSKSGKLLLKL